jgi:hypothetical protein
MHGLDEEFRHNCGPKLKGIYHVCDPSAHGKGKFVHGAQLNITA